MTELSLLLLAARWWWVLGGCPGHWRLAGLVTPAPRHATGLECAVQQQTNNTTTPGEGTTAKIEQNLSRGGVTSDTSDGRLLFSFLAQRCGEERGGGREIPEVRVLPD